jgi:endo-alpha-1,4-polygalactosaminidase (GH114 family)
MVRHIKKSYDRNLPDQTAVYRALRSIVCGINDLGLIVMPNGGDSFVRRFYTEHPTVIKTINQEGVLFEDFKKQPKSERQYRTEYMDWARKKGMYVRGIEYCKKTRHIAECKAYYKLHGWKGLYISKHTDLRGD